GFHYIYVVRYFVFRYYWFSISFYFYVFCIVFSKWNCFINYLRNDLHSFFNFFIKSGCFFFYVNKLIIYLYYVSLGCFCFIFLALAKKHAYFLRSFISLTSKSITLSLILTQFLI